MTEEGIEEMRNRVKQYAKEKGFVLNVDEKQLSAVLRGLARN
ncbi:MAG: ferredoxin:thioredoxin reductase, partial [Methanomicrobiales archaeon]|nr:ferredoxin:thioredoxin reductase [Methanomicrobiales archaeon]